MDIYSTAYMLAAVQEMPPEHTFFKGRYFPTNTALDVFGTSKVLIDYKDNSRKKAPFVMPRIGSVPIGREGFSTYDLEPAYIGIDIPLTIDQLNKRGFGESLMSTLTPEERARALLVGDLAELSARISRTEECLAIDTMLNNGTIMRHISDQPDVYVDVPVKFYDGKVNPCEVKVTEGWTHSEYKNNGWVMGTWYKDMCNMVKQLKRSGRACTEFLVSADVGEFLLEDPWVIAMLDNRRADFGMLAPEELTEYVTELGTFVFDGRRMRILISDGSYENEAGEDVPYIPEETVIATAPNTGKGLYGAITQLEADGEFHTYAGTRVPQHIFTMVPPVKATKLACAPLFVPVRSNPWVVARNVLTGNP